MLPAALKSASPPKPHPCDEAPPNTGDLLLRLCRVCDVSFTTVRLRDEAGGEHRRWAVVVQERTNPEAFFRIIGDSSVAALREAVLEAERRRWIAADEPFCGR